MSVVIRLATWDDRPAILALIATMGGHDDVLGHADPMRELGAVLRDPSARTLVAETDGRVVGVATLAARSSVTQDARIGIVSGVAVATAMRGRGIGAALIAEVEAAARTLGCERIGLASAQVRDRAHAFYRKLGFEQARSSVNFRRVVAPLAATAPLASRFLDAAARAATAVNAAIVELGDERSVGIGADGAATEAADRAAESAAVALLRALELPIVSEEAGTIGTLPRGDDVWISLDPLDGSRNFRAGFPSYGIAIGLVRGGVPLAGFVCDLASGRRWWACAGGPAFADGRIVRPRRGELIGMPSPPRSDDLVRPNVRHRVRISGSCALDLCRVADGTLAAFVALARPVVHSHDLAGPLAILNAAGAVVRDERGRQPPVVPDPAVAYRIVAAADAELAASLRAS